MEEVDASVIAAEFGEGIDGSDMFQGSQERPSGVTQAVKSLAELLMNRRPGDELVFMKRDAMQALRQP